MTNEELIGGLTDKPLTPQGEPNLDSQLDSLLSESRVIPIEPDVTPAGGQEGVTPANIVIPETPPNTEDNQGGEGDNEPDLATQLAERFKAETGYTGDIELNLDGFIKATNAIKEEVAKKYEVYEQDEEIRQLAEHKAQGGTIETFKMLPKAPDFTDVRNSLTPENVTLAEQLVREDLLGKGIRASIVEATINGLKDEGVLHEEASQALASKEERALAEFETKRSEIQATIEADRQAVIDSWKQVETVLSTGNVINGFKIDPKDFNEFKAVILPDPKTGQSKIHELRANLTVDQQLYIDFLIHKGFNVGKSIIGAVQPVKAPKEDLSLTMLTGGAKGSKSLATDDFMNQLANEFSQGK